MAKIIDKLRSTGKKIKKFMVNQIDLYNYENTETREATVQFLYEYAKNQRQQKEEYWQLMKRYYDGLHDTTIQMNAFCDSKELPWNPSQVNDGYIHVETQIDPNVPDFEFSGRDDDTDNQKAKERENVVRFVIDNNPMELMQTRNERRMNLYGLACWKVAWDNNIKINRYQGDISIGNPKLTQLFIDPNVIDDIDDAEYVGMAYPMHRMKAQRTFKNDLKRMGMTILDFDTGYKFEDTEFMRFDTTSETIDTNTYDLKQETVQVLEWYFKQPESGKKTIDGIKYEWEAGDIGLIILINMVEVRYVPKYWVKTSCQMYPFSIYCKVPNEESIYGKSEIEMIKNQIDSADRAISYAQLNDAFTSNDIVVVESNSLEEGYEIKNVPGEIVKVKTGMANSVRRLANLTAAHKEFYSTVDKFKEYMQQTNGNFDAFQGNEPQRVTTATGIAILNDRSRARVDVKKIDRTAGFERLYRLIDYTALEFYDDDRIIFIGAKSENQQPVNFMYNSDNMRSLDTMTNEFYYPIVDVKVNIGDGLKNSKAFTVQSIQELIGMPVTPMNYKIVEAYLDLIDIPQSKELKDFIEQVIGQVQQQQQMQQQQQIQNSPEVMNAAIGNLSAEEMQFLQDNPQVMEQAAGMINK